MYCIMMTTERSVYVLCVQEKRKKPDPPKPPNGQMSTIMEESRPGQAAAEEDQHGDTTLQRTGRWLIIVYCLLSAERL